MPKILFIQPTQYGGDGLCKQCRIHLPGLAFPHLAALTPRHWEVELKLEVIEDVDFDTDADLVGIGTMGHSIFRGFELADEFRRRGKRVVMGGYMASMAREETLEHADSVVVGDAEIGYPRLLADFEATGRIQRIYDDRVDSLAGLPVPRYELFRDKPIGPMLPVQAGRGCPHDCSFCSIACLYRGRYLRRPVDEVVRDIEAVRAHGYRKFFLIDDNLVADPEYLAELCRRVTPLGMTWSSQCSLELAKYPDLLRLVRQSGVVLLSFGLEGIVQEGLDRLGKWWLKADEHAAGLAAIQRAGIMVSTEMMLGTDGDTEESIRETLRFVERNRIPIPRFYILTPIPGTDLFDQCRREGRLLNDDFRQYDGSRCVHRPARMTAERVTDLYWWLNRRVFSWRSIARRTVGNAVLWKNPWLCVFALAVNVHYRGYVKRGITPNIF